MSRSLIDVLCAVSTHGKPARRYRSKSSMLTRAMQAQKTFKGGSAQTCFQPSSSSAVPACITSHRARCVHSLTPCVWHLDTGAPQPVGPRFHRRFPGPAWTGRRLGLGAGTLCVSRAVCLCLLPGASGLLHRVLVSMSLLFFIFRFSISHRLFCPHLWLFCAKGPFWLRSFAPIGLVDRRVLTFALPRTERARHCAQLHAGPLGSCRDRGSLSSALGHFPGGREPWFTTLSHDRPWRGTGMRTVVGAAAAATTLAGARVSDEECWPR